MITHFTSDPHYGHKNIISHCNRPFVSICEMQDELIRRYNAVVPVEGCTLWAGDAFFCGTREAQSILSKLNGRKILVRGNHDRKSRIMAGLGFDIVTDEMVIQIAGRPVRIKHYPYHCDRFPERCPKMRPNELLIHGHTHSTEKLNGTQIHVGVDAWNYAPATLKEIEELVKQCK